MAWTSPMTWVANSVLTAAQLNTHLRDNLQETMPARATTAGEYFVTDSNMRLAARQGAKDTIVTSESTTSTEYTDLATVGPKVSVTTGGSMIIFFGAEMRVASAGQVAFAAVEVTDTEGTRTIGPDDTVACVFQGGGTNYTLQFSHHLILLNDFPAGTQTVTMKYRALGTGTFSRRRISVMPLN